MQHIFNLTWLAPLALAGLAACGSNPSSPARPSADLPPLALQKACASLSGLGIPAAEVGLPTRGAKVLAATEVADTDAAGQARRYCKVTGEILAVDTTTVTTLSTGARQTGASPIRFQVNLPERWNQRALQFGGGGTNGSVITGLDAFSGAPADIPTPLARGYLTLGSDSGHSSAGMPPFDTSFALNQEELLNFAHQQIKKTLDVARFVAQQAYGQKPRLTYFIGGSQGGHEGFDAAQRYPADYDGVVAHYPAYNVINLWHGAWAQARAIYGNRVGVESPAWMSPAHVALLVGHVREQCDALDGLADGIISDVRACNAKVTPASVRAALRCTGAAASNCLTDAQLAAVAKLASTAQFNVAFAGGSTSYGRWPILEGATFLGIEHLGKGPVADLGRPPFRPDGSAFQLFPAKGMVQGFVARDLLADPLAYEPAAWAARVQQVSAWADASSTDLSAFAARGGKLLLTHGSIDDSITPHNTIAYWDRLVAANGRPALDRFMRFYLVPGQGHGRGIFASRHDWLDTLTRWVEAGEAPGRLIARDGNTGEATAATNGRTRPLCLYGSYPRYTGPASPSQAQANDAAHFQCSPY